MSITNIDTRGITFTPKKLAAFKKEYEKCDSEKDVFTFEGHDILAAYAKYLIQYVEEYFKGLGMAGLPQDRMKYKHTDKE